QENATALVAREQPDLSHDFHLVVGRRNIDLPLAMSHANAIGIADGASGHGKNNLQRITEQNDERDGRGVGGVGDELKREQDGDALFSAEAIEVESVFPNWRPN